MANETEGRIRVPMDHGGLKRSVADGLESGIREDKDL